MFEDGPPPLPPSLPPSEAAAEAALADLTDDNRLTAVADEDLDSDHESRPSCTPAVPNFDPDVFENISRSTETADALDRIPSLGKEGAYGTYESKNEPQETGTNTESPSGLTKDCSEIPVPTVAEGVANESNTMVSPEEKRPNENVQEIERTEGEINVIREVTSNRHLPSAFQGPIKYSASAEHEHSQVEMRPTESEETVSPSEQEPEVSFANEIRPQVVLEEKTEDKSKSDQPAEAVENTSEEMRVQPSVSPSFLEKTDDAITAVGGTFEATAEGNRDDDDDDFGDFEEFGEFAETRFEESNAIEEPKERQQDFGGWAAFETAPSSSQDVKEGGEDEWAADFTTAPSPPASSTWQQAPSSGEQRYDRIELCALCDIYGRDSLWTAENVDWDGGEDEPESCEDELQGVTESLDGAQLTLDNLKPWQSSWLAISVVEDALALKMQWPHSVFYSKFLDSLSLDANLAAMRNSDLPAFAQQLGESAILQPISTADYADTNFESTPPLSNLCLSQSDHSPTAVPLKAPKGSSNSLSQTQRPRSVPVDSLAVPPAQFDWGNSGLTNPLTAGSISASSALLDLDFLTANESRIVTIAGRSSTTADISAALQKDLAALGLNPSEMGAQKGTDGVNNGENKSNLLEKLMKKGKREHKYTRPSELSLDARALHDRLPDLDYMLANVLLFPMANR